MRIFYCLSITATLSLTLLSCSDSSKTDREVIKEMEKSLNNSNATINSFTLATLNKLENKKNETGKKERAGIWFPKAQRIITITEAYFAYLEALKRLDQISREKSDELFNTLGKYKEDILATDSVLRKAFSNPSELYFTFNSIEFTKEELYNNFFKKMSKESLNSFLTEIQNRMKNFEAKAVVFCNEQVGAIIEYFDSYSTIVGQNANILKQGSYLEITAGVGVFSRKANPEITINRKIYPLNESGYTSLKLKTPTTPGNYSVPVKIKFIDQDGKENIVEQNVEYTVAKECDQ